MSLPLLDNRLERVSIMVLNLKTKVVLPCTVEDKEGLLQWTKDDFGLGTKRDLPGYSRSSCNVIIRKISFVICHISVPLPTHV